jgi:mRNA-degrading endonuclease RelE of RelBE toxin-antitoxin system
MRVSYLDAADSELLDEVKEAVERIKNYPDAWTQLSERLRRCQVHRFPYRIIYQVRNDLLLIVAVQHHRRKPENWRTRLK